MTNFTGVHVVIVDDDKGSIDVLMRCCQKLHITFTVISQGNQVQTEIKRLPRIDAMFLDLAMETDGYEVLKAIRADPATSSTRVIAYTAHTSHIGTAQDAGFDGFLGKPVDLAKFSSYLESVLEGNGPWIR